MTPIFFCLSLRTLVSSESTGSRKQGAGSREKRAGSKGEGVNREKGEGSQQDVSRELAVSMESSGSRGEREVRKDRDAAMRRGQGLAGSQ